ncbi:FAD binding domain protein [Cadophora sp. DSE1049]|nr:FAD binding domain protein [Cadophora sp. DSE1049]
MAEVIEVPVVIVGGGSCGLNLSIYLSKLGVQHVLFERHPGTAILPKAHIINQRTMEIFRQYDIAKPIIEKGTPPHLMSKVLWQTSLGGDGPLDRKVIGSIDSWGCKPGTPTYKTYQRDAPHMPTNLPLIHSEPIFRRIAEELNPGKILFGHNVASFSQTSDQVLVQVEAVATGVRSTYRAQYLYGADGGKTIGVALNIEMQGPKAVRQMISTHFRADVSAYWDEEACIINFANPEHAHRSGAMLPVGLTWGPHAEEWQIHFVTEMGDGVAEGFDTAAAKTHIRKLLKLPDLAIEVISIGSWTIERVLASSYRQGRIFLGGDSAHRHPPTTGLGLNTAVADAHNIAWKLALVLSGAAGPELLDTYEPERRRIGKQVTDWAFFTWQHRAILGAAIGLHDGKPEANTSRVKALFEDTELARAARAAINNVIATQHIEFSAHELDLGFYYTSGVLLDDGKGQRPPEDPTHQVYTPSTAPGYRLPHVWLKNSDGVVVSTHDLVGTDGDCLLMTDEAGTAVAAEAVTAARKLKLQLRSVTIRRGDGKGEYIDAEGRWASLGGLDEGGVVLVRPDNVVAWRSVGASTAAEIVNVLELLLRRKHFTNGHAVVS